MSESTRWNIFMELLHNYICLPVRCVRWRAGALSSGGAQWQNEVRGDLREMTHNGSLTVHEKAKWKWKHFSFNNYFLLTFSWLTLSKMRKGTVKLYRPYMTETERGPEESCPWCWNESAQWQHGGAGSLWEVGTNNHDLQGIQAFREEFKAF